MERVKKIVTNRKTIILAICLAIILVYVLFFKPSPTVRLNWNKIRATGEVSTLSLEAPSEVSGVDKKFIVKINLDTKGYLVNAVQSNLQFDPRVLEVSKMSTEKSFCKFYPVNTFSNSKGTINLSCGAPYPGFSGKNVVLEIEFLAKAVKTTDIYFLDDSMVLANDGKATNLLKDFDKASVRIKAAL